VGYDAAAGVATLTLDHPENRNALTPVLLEELGRGLTRALADDTVRVVVVTNTGPAFCAGADLKAPVGSAFTGTGEWSLVRIFDLMATSPKPVVGRIAGHCMGGGVGLAAACDISIASDDIRLGFTEVRIGVAPAVISVVCLPKLREADARELFLTGERITAGRAAEVGLINRAVPADRLDTEVATVVGQLLAGAPGALAAAKRLVTDVPAMTRAAAFTWTEQISAALFAGPEATAGMEAFREKRPAPWVRA
jgi:methylglutaconyl-CoA hydratase